MPQALSKYRKDIQVLRGIAVAAVVLFHANADWFPLGYLGVDVFFVISGFVVTPLIIRIFIDETTGGVLNNLYSFYRRRIYRLAPALGVTLAISTIAIFLAGILEDHQRFARQGIATLLLLGNVGASRYSGDYFSPNPNPLVHTWSLSVEEQIYLFLPILLIVLINNRVNIEKRFLLIMSTVSGISLLLAIEPSLLQAIYLKVGPLDVSSISFYSPLSRIWEFCFGGIIFLWYKRKERFNPGNALKFALVLGLLLTLFFLPPWTIDTRIASILACSLAGGGIYLDAFAILPQKLGNILEWIGDRSYSIYLVHMPILYIVKYSPLSIFVNHRPQLTLLAVIISFVLGASSFTFVEERFRLRTTTGKTKATPLLTLFLISILMPALLLVGMDVGVRKNCWGLTFPPERPAYAGFLDPNCARDSFNGPAMRLLNLVGKEGGTIRW